MARVVVSSPPLVLEGVEGKTLRDVVRKAGLSTTEFIALLDGTPVPLDAIIEPSDEIRLVRIVSGG